MKLAEIRDRLPLSVVDADYFAPPPGWTEHVSSERRTIATKWLRDERKRDGSAISVEGRAELERLLEMEARAKGAPWLGQLVDGRWQVRRRAVDEALEWVLGVVRPEKSRHWLCALSGAPPSAPPTFLDAFSDVVYRCVCCDCVQNTCMVGASSTHFAPATRLPAAI